MQKDLKETVIDLLDESVEFTLLSLEESAYLGFELSETTPIITLPVPGGWQIIAATDVLNRQEQAEAIAHELGHLLLKGLGLYDVNIGDDYPEVYLAQEMNSVISHQFVLRKLAKEYGIPSYWHIQQREAILEMGHSLIAEYSDENVMLYAIGLHLLDLSVTTISNETEIAELLQVSSVVRKSFEIGREFLIYPEEVEKVPPAEEQWLRVSNYLQNLGLKPGNARLVG